MRFYVARRGQRAGPYTEEQLHGMLAKKIAQPGDLACHEGLEDWEPLHTLLGLEGPPPLPEAEEAAPAYSAPTSRTWGPRGVGGWLLFFCVSLTILSPLMSVGMIALTWGMPESTMTSSPSLMKAVIWEEAASFALMLYGVVVGCLIWRGSPRGRKIAQVYLLVRLAAFFAIEGGTLLMMNGLPARIYEAGLREGAGSLIRTLIHTIIWWVYFKKSVRVKNTYGPEGA